jgi:hypothetical protein
MSGDRRNAKHAVGLPLDGSTKEPPTFGPRRRGAKMVVFVIHSEPFARGSPMNESTRAQRLSSSGPRRRGLGQECDPGSCQTVSGAQSRGAACRATRSSPGVPSYRRLHGGGGTHPVGASPGAQAHRPGLGRVHRLGALGRTHRAGGVVGTRTMTRLAHLE